MVTIDREEIAKNFTDAGFSIIPDSLNYAVLTWTSRNIRFNSFDEAMRSAGFTDRIKKSFGNMVDLDVKLGSETNKIKNIVLNYPKVIVEPYEFKKLESVDPILNDFISIGEIKLPFPAMTMVEAMSQDGRTIDGFTHIFLTQEGEVVEVLIFVGLSAHSRDYEQAFSSMLPFRMTVGVVDDHIRFQVKAVGYRKNDKKEICLPNKALMTGTLHSVFKCIHKMTINDGGEGCYISKPTPREVQVNRKKLAKKKAPLVEFRLIKIEPRKIQLPSMPHGTHASPRQHWRRGHWRTYASGKRVFVNPMLVGDPKNGKIIKDYVVGGETHAH